MIDLAELTDADLDSLYLAVNAEVGRRRTLKAIPQQMAELNRAYQTSSGYQDGEPWQPRMGAVGAYMDGDRVTHRDKTWESLIDFNVQEPGDPADPQAYRWWADLSDPVPEGEWAPGVEYETGQTVTYNGVEYTCIQAHTSNTGWEPPLTAALWQPVEGT